MRTSTEDWQHDLTPSSIPGEERWIDMISRKWSNVKHPLHAMSAAVGSAASAGTHAFMSAFDEWVGAFESIAKEVIPKCKESNTKAFNVYPTSGDNIMPRLKIPLPPPQTYKSSRPYRR